ncbi:MAG: hypothetical protein A2017_00780 [Lentisphaerae bacterium GWF2_44_16]|nr:MAG: hypothetical protein A2017_00780 [Lentisphaerae bacterium GWF2_44_16]
MFKFLSSVILLSFSFLYVLPLSAETPMGQGPGGGVLQKKTTPPPAPGHSGGPGDCLPVIVNGTTFFYAAGLFYQRGSDGYVLVAPPHGAVVPVLPEGNMIVTVNGGTYYYYSHTYYTMDPNGAYMVVNDPTAPLPPAPPVAAPPPTSPPSSTTTTTTVYPAQQQVIITRPAPITIVRSPDSQNPVKKLGRGLFCAAFGFLEIPKNMGETARKEGMPQAMSYGFLKGAGFFILRETAGALEAGTFIFPLPGTIENGVRDWGYGPLMEPEWIIK